MTITYNIPINRDFRSLPNLAVFWQDNLLAVDFRPVVTTFADRVFGT